MSEMDSLEDNNKSDLRDWSAWLGVLVVGLCGLVYANSLHGVFVMDDFGTIVKNPHIESLWPLSRSMSAPAGTGSSGRPIAALSFAVNYALGGRDVVGYHLFSILLHVLAGLALFGCVRRALLARSAPALQRVPPTLAATLIAGLWVLHPLHSAALNHLTYRNEVLLGLFYLLALYAALRGLAAERGTGGDKSARWFLLAVCASAIAMGCKEPAVSLPLMILCLNVTLFGEGWLEALRRHKAFYSALACTWLLLLWIVMGGDRGESVGSGVHGTDSIDYLRTQAGVLVHYLKLAFWPHPLIFDYRDWPIAPNWGAVRSEALLVLVLFGGAALGLMRRSALGALGVGVFALLAPSSSFIPITGAPAAEHRMYLPLAGLMVLAACGFTGLARALGLEGRKLRLTLIIASLLVAAPLARTTFLRNRDYRSGLALWSDTVEKRPDSSLAWTNYGGVLFHLGQRAQALEAVQRATQLDPGNHLALGNLGTLLREQGDLPGVVEAYRKAVAARPDLGPLHLELGRALLDLGQAQEGLGQLEAAMARGLAPTDLERVCVRVAFVRATALDAKLRDGKRALELAQRLTGLAAGSAARHLAVQAAALAELGHYAQAASAARKALELARAAGRRRFVQELGVQLKAYEAGRPWRQALR